MATLDELTKQLKDTGAALAALAPDDPNRFDLEILRSQLKQKIVAEAFNIDDDIAAITVADLTKLKALTADLRAATLQEEQRAQLVGQIVGVAKKLIGAAGVPIP